MGGEELLDEQIRQATEAALEVSKGDAEGDSPIELLLARALRLRVQMGICEVPLISFTGAGIELVQLLQRTSPMTMVVAQQVVVAGWRVDFLVHAYDWGRATGREQWRRLIVECDGHDFHERTKEQARRDRSRDRDAQMLGFAIMRFTGSEIHRDPLGCARQITDWAERGW